MHKETATDIVAWAIVNLQVQVPLDYFLNISPTSDLYSALVRQWKIKCDMETERYAMIACTVANSMGGNKLKARDFYNPLSDHFAQSELKAKEASLKNYLIRHNDKQKL